MIIRVFFGQHIFGGIHWNMMNTKSKEEMRLYSNRYSSTGDDFSRRYKSSKESLTKNIDSSLSRKQFSETKFYKNCRKRDHMIYIQIVEKNITRIIKTEKRGMEMKRLSACDLVI